MSRKFAVIGSALFIAGALFAGVSYDAETGTIVVDDFVASFPCSPETLYRADKMNGWGKVRYDKTGDSWTVDANLIIGRNNGRDTYFQLGSAERPNETLTVNGSVTVYPYYVKGKNVAGTATLHEPKNVNRLTLGSETDPRLRPTLKIYSDEKRKNGLYVGWFFDGDKIVAGSGGEIMAYNAVITAAVPDKAHAFGGPDPNRKCLIYGAKNVFKNTTISWFAGFFIYDNRFWKFELDNAVFENGGTALVSPIRDYRNLTFRNLERAVYDYGTVDTTLTNCVFAGNVKNWELRYNARLKLVDCHIGAAKADEVAATRSENGWFPKVEVYRSLAVKVVDAAGAPVIGAEVRATAENGAGTVENPIARTGLDGMTPARESPGAICLLEYAVRTSRDRLRGERSGFLYAIAAGKNGKSAALRDFNPAGMTVPLTIALPQ